MNPAVAFADYLQDTGVAIRGTDLFIHRAPSSNEAPDALWWIVASGGQPIQRATTGEAIKEYQIDVRYRDRSGQRIYEEMFSLEEQLNCTGCIDLTGFDALGVSAVTFPIDEDLDSEDRSVGLVQVTIRTYKSCLDVS